MLDSECVISRLYRMRLYRLWRMSQLRGGERLHYMKPPMRDNTSNIKLSLHAYHKRITQPSDLNCTLMVPSFHFIGTIIYLHPQTMARWQVKDKANGPLRRGSRITYILVDIDSATIFATPFRANNFVHILTSWIPSCTQQMFPGTYQADDTCRP